MTTPVLLLLLLQAGGAVIPEVRALIARMDFPAAEERIRRYRETRGVTPEMIEALSWLGRGALAEKQHERALSYAAETRKLALEFLKGRKLDGERHLPIALGASIEVEAQATAAGGGRSEAVAFLQRELQAWRGTSIVTRIQKNINLLSLEGKPAPPLEISSYVGSPPAALERLKGRAVLLFFWAHWCGDCISEAPMLARIRRDFPSLVLAGPTRLYGYTARGREAPPAEEMKYIEQVRLKHYADLDGVPFPVSEKNFERYGASTTPTLVLIDGAGIVRLYRPGGLSYEELKSRIAALLT